MTAIIVLWLARCINHISFALFTVVNCSVHSKHVSENVNLCLALVNVG